MAKWGERITKVWSAWRRRRAESSPREICRSSAGAERVCVSDDTARPGTDGANKKVRLIHRLGESLRRDIDTCLPSGSCSSRLRDRRDRHRAAERINEFETPGSVEFTDALLRVRRCWLTPLHNAALCKPGPRATATRSSRRRTAVRPRRGLPQHHRVLRHRAHVQARGEGPPHANRGPCLRDRAERATGVGSQNSHHRLEARITMSSRKTRAGKEKGLSNLRSGEVRRTIQPV